MCIYNRLTYNYDYYVIAEPATSHISMRLTSPRFTIVSPFVMVKTPEMQALIITHIPEVLTY